MKLELFEIAGRRAVPTGKPPTTQSTLRDQRKADSITRIVFILSIKDGVVHFVGDPSDVNDEVDRALASC
jgi:hypothetical protein